MYKTRGDVAPVIDGHTRHWQELPTKIFRVIEQQTPLGWLEAVPSAGCVQVDAETALTDLEDGGLLRRMCDEERNATT